MTTLSNFRSVILGDQIFVPPSVKSSHLKLQSPCKMNKSICKTIQAKTQQYGGTIQKPVSVSVNSKKKGQFYFNITGFPFPLSPLFQRQTLRYEVEGGRIWMFEQEQGLGFSNVTTNIRMTIIRLQSGGLWVHAPIAPTAECISLIEELGAPVEHIILPTFAYEHKVYVGPFSRCFPKAKVWVAPAQWSWPLNLPTQLFGIFPAGILEDNDKSTPWADEIEQKVLQSPEVGIGPYVEVSFFHRPSRTLLVTDAVIRVPRKPPAVVRKEAFLQAAKNGLAVQLLSKGKVVSKEPVEDTPATRQKGWQRMVLQILFFGPSNLLEPEETFRQISERLIVSPVIKTLVFNKVPDQVKVWTDSMASEWNFRQIIPAHFAAPIKAGPNDLRATFSFLDDLVSEPPPKEGIFQVLNKFLSKGASFFSGEDMKTLSTLDSLLVSVGAVKKTVSGRSR